MTAITRLEIDDPGWLAFVSASENATVFHHPAWAKLLADSYRYRAFVLAVSDQSGNVSAGLPVVDISNRLTGKRWSSLPYTDACPPLVAPGGSLEELTELLSAERRLQGLRELEVRADLPGPHAHRRSHSFSHVLALGSDPEETTRGFKLSVRQNIAQAERAGLTIRRAEAAADVSNVYYRLQLRTRRRLGVPVQPRRYFTRLWQSILEPGLGACFVAYLDREPVAGAVFLGWKSTALFKYAASDERYLGLRPNHLLLAEAMRWCAASGYTLLDFGRTDADNPGLRRFKTSWGAREEPLVYSTLADAAPTPASSPRGASLGPLIRHSPPGVCRMLGELLYRYAA